jgi:DNA-binding NtrC family response regulator
VRVIATTNRSLPALIEAGTFRADLYYRLNVIPFTIPTLQQRRGDILTLAQHFLRKYEPKAQGRRFHIAPELAAAMEDYDWPGNVRELENFIRRALALTHSTTLGVELFATVSRSQAPAPAALPKPGLTLQDMERSLLEATLLATNGNRTRTAEMMGVSLRTVRNKIREYGLAAREAAV